MTATPRVSIGLPVYNGQAFLGEALDALLGQTFADFELIISDNASTDATPDICRDYARQDDRIRYIRQPVNIGSSPNHNLLVDEARGDLFKWASHDDLYARELLERCVGELDRHPGAVLAHSWTAMIDETGATTRALVYDLDTASPHAPRRFASLLFDDGGDDIYGVIRTSVIRRVVPQGSYHHSDRSIVGRLGLLGPFRQVPDWLFFRREHRNRATALPSVRRLCANMDPRRADRLRHPAPRLYAEYVWSYISGIRRAPLTPSERRECYRLVVRWLTARGVPRRTGATAPQAAAPGVVVPIGSLVARAVPEAR